MLSQFFAELGLHEPSLEINSLGCPECRPAYRDRLKEFLRSRLDALCEDCCRRFESNPLRVLDCKVERCKNATLGAPAMLEHLCPACDAHFAATRRYLELVATPYRINNRMVRGLDYYTRTTFEMVTGLLGSQSAVAAGGRYDGLISDLGGPEIPGIGFAMGVERIALLLEAEQFSTVPLLFIVALGEQAGEKAFAIASELQRNGVSVEFDFEGKSMKSQMRRADKLSCRYTLIIGEAELASGVAPLKEMATGMQIETALESQAIALKLKS